MALNGPTMKTGRKSSLLSGNQKLNQSKRQAPQNKCNTTYGSYSMLQKRSQQIHAIILGFSWGRECQAVPIAWGIESASDVRRQPTFAVMGGCSTSTCTSSIDLRVCCAIGPRRRRRLLCPLLCLGCTVFQLCWLFPPFQRSGRVRRKGGTAGSGVAAGRPELEAADGPQIFLDVANLSICCCVCPCHHFMGRPVGNP